MTPRARRDRPGNAEARLAMYRTEIAQRAALLHRLGFSQARAQARLLKNLAWDFETAGRPAGLTDDEIGKLVKSAFAR